MEWMHRTMCVGAKDLAKLGFGQQFNQQAMRHRERQLRAWHRHERMTVRLELATEAESSRGRCAQYPKLSDGAFTGSA